MMRRGLERMQQLQSALTQTPETPAGLEAWWRITRQKLREGSWCSTRCESGRMCAGSLYGYLLSSQWLSKTPDPASFPSLPGPHHLSSPLLFSFSSG